MRFGPYPEDVGGFGVVGPGGGGGNRRDPGTVVVNFTDPSTRLVG